MSSEDTSDELLAINNYEGECHDLEQSFRLANEALEKAIETNQIEDAVQMMSPFAETSLYHSSLQSILLILQAGLTLTKDNLESAQHSTEQTEKLSNKYRRNGFIDSVIKMFRTPNYDKYSDKEVLAQLIYAKFLGMSAILCALEANSVYSLIKLAYRLRSCVSAFRECRVIWKTRTKWETEVTRQHFDAGVRLANGIQHLFISHTPPRLLKIVNFLGYKGVASRAFEELQRAAFETEGGVSSLAAEVVLLYYWVIVEPHLSLGPKDSTASQRIIDNRLQRFPKSLLYRLLNAKLVETSGRIDEAIELYKNCLVQDNTLASSHKIFHMHLGYCYALKREWDDAIRYIQLAREEARHSPAILCNIEAVLSYAKSVDNNDPEMRKRASELFREIPGMRVRYLGKTITIEKMAVELANEYFKNNETLVLPEMDTLYQSNFLYFIKNNPTLLNRHLTVINKTLNSYANHFVNNERVDEYLMALFFKGVILKLMGQLDDAEECFNTILKEQSRITRFLHVRPQSVHELAVIAMYRNNCVEAKALFKRAIKDYSGYLTENFVHLRAYSGLRELGFSTDKHEIKPDQRKEFGKEWLEELEIDDNCYKNVLKSEGLVLN